MSQQVLSLVSMLELFACVFYLLVGAFSSPWIQTLYLLALLGEPAGYYVFAGYVAMRNVQNTLDLVTMMLVLPLYYLSLLVMLVLRLDMHASPFLSSLVYYDFSPLSLSKQLIVHLYCVSGPLLCLTAANVLYEGLSLLGICTFGVLVGSTGYFHNQVEKLRMRRRRAGNHPSDHNLSESSMELTYLNYTPIVSFEEARLRR